MSTAVQLSLEEKIDALTSLVKEQHRKSFAPCLTCSFQAEDMVALHAVRQLAPAIPVLFLDTGYHFDEVYAYRDEMVKVWDLNLVNILPGQTVAEQESQFGILYQSAPDRCCGLRKVQPLFASLEPYDVWFTGLRREQSKSRAELQDVDTFKLPTGKSIDKISPLALWTTRDVWQYATRNKIPLLSLYDKGYSSIGCRPCTSLPSDPNDPRSGRWSGQKLECGIHIQPA
jgi:phosphoadenosine phosphosulfate reductase